MASLIPAWQDGVLKPLDKLEVHQLGLRHKAVSVFVMAGDYTLLQRRALGKYHTPGLWANTCCTHPDWEEASSDCAIRRLDEELGINDVTPQFRDQVEYRADVGGGMIEHEVVDIFTVTADQSLPMNLNPDEVSEVRWMTLPDLQADIAKSPDIYTPWIKIYLAEHRDVIFDP